MLPEHISSCRIAKAAHDLRVADDVREQDRSETAYSRRMVVSVFLLRFGRRGCGRRQAQELLQGREDRQAVVAERAAKQYEACVRYARGEVAGQVDHCPIRVVLHHERRHPYLREQLGNIVHCHGFVDSPSHLG